MPTERVAGENESYRPGQVHCTLHAPIWPLDLQPNRSWELPLPFWPGAAVLVIRRLNCHASSSATELRKRKTICFDFMAQWTMAYALE